MEQMSLSLRGENRETEYNGISRKIACTLVAPAYIFVPRSTAMLQSRLLLPVRSSRIETMHSPAAHSILELYPGRLAETCKEWMPVEGHYATKNKVGSLF
jgi:hypothetical protein